jgi:hypothetical protein
MSKDNEPCAAASDPAARAAIIKTAEEKDDE